VDEERYSYSLIDRRPKLEWPGGKRLALWVVPNIEHYEYLPRVRVRNPWPRMPHPDVLGYSLRDYGNRVGVWRLLEVMDRHAIRGTVSLNLAVCEHYPEIFEAIEARRWDVLCHGIYNTRYHWNLSEEEERAEIAECVATWRRLTGRQLAGWFSPGVSNTLRTPDLVAEAGFKYSTDFYHDDQPTPLRVKAGRLVSVPYTMELNDAVVHRYDTEGEEFARLIRDQFETLYAEGAESGRVMCIALHPYIVAQPHRIRHLDRVLGYIMSHEGVWQATGEEIADWYLAHGLAAYQRHLGREA
jgi:peptidoglycan/xylan/chitin deacetylase (PgdA/CDA1 family)